VRLDSDTVRLVTCALDSLCRGREPTAAARLRTAGWFAAHAHHGQRRRSGEPYITHPLAVAGLVASWGMDDASIAAALCHDVVEDTPATLDDLKGVFGGDDTDRLFGLEVAVLVDGLTKLDGLKLGGVAGAADDAAAAATLCKFLLAMAEDVRVLVVKLADRLHNVRTLDALPGPKASRIARETMDVYAPLAHRLGIAHVAGELEDRCFAVLFPTRYAELETMVAERVADRESWLAEVRDTMSRALHDHGIDAEVAGRTKHLFSVYSKMVVRGRSFDQIYDLVGVRILVDTVADCYAALGVVHTLWPPVPGRIKDWVASPKFNLYQSLHTTVVGPGGTPVEVQIRTHVMHRRAEWGVAAHWRYKGDPDPVAETPAWLERLKGSLSDVTDATVSEWDATAFLDQLRRELAGDDLFCFTPTGQVLALPAESTPVDFAYAIHTEVGHACSGAKINGRLVPLSTRLTNGDRVEILTGRKGPNRDWLSFVASARARSRIRQWFARERRAESTTAGRAAISRKLGDLGVPVRFHRLEDDGDLPSSFGYQDHAQLFAAVAENKLSAEQVARRFLERGRPPSPEVDGTPPGPAPVGRRRRRPPRNAVVVDALDGVAVRLARCCGPVPGDPIVGRVTSRGDRAVVVHRAVCHATVDTEPGPLVDVSWGDDPTGVVVRLAVESHDRAGLLSDVTRAIGLSGGNILASSTATGRDMVARQRFDVELSDPAGVDVVCAAIRKVPGVYSAVRV
jgi:GTP pyrophosphokinase